jgi:hypothetical protein
VEDPDDFLTAVAAKRLELKRQLESRRVLAQQNVRIDPRRVLAVAADPFRSIGWRTEADTDAIDTHGAWDGMADVTTLLQRLESPLASNGARAASIERRLRQHWLRGATWTQRARDRSALAGRLERLAEASHAEARGGEALAATLLEQAQGIARRRVSELFADLRDPAVAETRAEQLKRWWTDPRLIAALETWHVRAEQEIDAWRDGAQSRLEAMVEDAELRAAWERVGTAPELGPNPKRARGAVRGAVKGASRSRDVLRAADRKVILDVGHKVFRHKFRPWEAKKLADKFTRASKVAGRAAFVLSVVTAAWDVHRFFKGRRTAREAEAEFQRRLKELLAAVDAWVEEALKGTEGDPGAVTAVHAMARRLVDLGVDHRAEADQQRAREEDALQHADDDRALIDDGLRLLRRPVTTVASWS